MVHRNRVKVDTAGHPFAITISASAWCGVSLFDPGNHFIQMMLGPDIRLLINFQRALECLAQGGACFWGAALGIGVWGAWFGVGGLGCGVWGWGLGVWGLVCGVRGWKGLGFRIWNVRLGARNPTRTPNPKTQP